MRLDNRLIASTFALIAGAAIAANLVSPARAGEADYALGTIYEDVWGAPLYSTGDVASFVVNGLPLAECTALRDQLNAKGGFTACFGADVSTVDSAPADATIEPPQEMTELDPVACRIAENAPTDANLRQCYGAVEGAMW